MSVPARIEAWPARIEACDLSRFDEHQCNSAKRPMINKWGHEFWVHDVRGNGEINEYAVHDAFLTSGAGPALLDYGYVYVASGFTRKKHDRPVALIADEDGEPVLECRAGMSVAKAFLRFTRKHYPNMIVRPTTEWAMEMIGHAWAHNTTPLHIHVSFRLHDFLKLGSYSIDKHSCYNADRVRLAEAENVGTMRAETPGGSTVWRCWFRCDPSIPALITTNGYGYQWPQVYHIPAAVGAFMYRGAGTPEREPIQHDDRTAIRTHINRGVGVYVNEDPHWYGEGEELLGLLYTKDFIEPTTPADVCTSVA